MSPPCNTTMNIMDSTIVKTLVTGELESSSSGHVSSQSETTNGNTADSTSFSIESSSQTNITMASPCEDDKKMIDQKVDADVWSYIFLFLVIFISFYTVPADWNGTKVLWQHVWYYGWITAVSTGFGALPFFIVSNPNKFWMGVSNGTSLLIHDSLRLYSFMNYSSSCLSRIPSFLFSYLTSLPSP